MFIIFTQKTGAVHGAYTVRILVHDDVMFYTHIAAANSFVKSIAATHRGCEASMLYVGFLPRVAQ